MGVRIRDLINWDAARDWLLNLGANTALQSAEFLAARTKDYCPVDTGHLRDSVQVVRGESRWHYFVVVAAEYAEAVHEGHYAANQWGKTNVWVAGNPFLEYAIQDTAKHFPRITVASAQSTSGGAMISSVTR